MIKKLVGFLTILCMAFFIAGCSSTPDVSGTYLYSNKESNTPIATIILKKVNDTAYDYSYFVINRHTGKMEQEETKRMTLNTEKKALEENSMIPSTLFFNENYNSLKEVHSSKNIEYIYNKLSDSEMKQYQHLFE